MQVEKQTLEEQLTQQAADASILQSELAQSASDCHGLAQRLSSTQTELCSSVEQTQRKEQELARVREAAAARELESAAELDSTKAQAGQLARQLSERIQRLDALQVPTCVSLSCKPCLGFRRRGDYEVSMVFMSILFWKKQHVAVLL